MNTRPWSDRCRFPLLAGLVALSLFAWAGCDSAAAGDGGGGGDDSSLYSVVYDGNGADGGEPPVDENRYEAGAIATVLESGNLTRTAHAFAGWNPMADGTGDQYAPGDELTIGDADVALYAQWSPGTSVTIDFSDPDDPEVTFDFAGGEVDRGTVLDVSASSGYSSYEWYVDGLPEDQSAAISADGETATVDTGELGPGPHTLAVVVDGLYSAQLSFTVVTG